MRVSHSWTPQLNILEILKHFWPASEPCRHANIKDMDGIFPVRALPSLIYPPCKYEGMYMHSWSTVVCQIWGQFRWNLVLYGSKCPILKGVHQTARSPNGIFPVRALPSLIYPPCKYEGMYMHSWSTVVCQIWGQFRWNLVLYGSKCPILKGVHQTARSPNGLSIQG